MPCARFPIPDVLSSLFGVFISVNRMFDILLSLGEYLSESYGLSIPYRVDLSFLLGELLSVNHVFGIMISRGM